MLFRFLQPSRSQSLFLRLQYASWTPCARYGSNILSPEKCSAHHLLPYVHTRGPWIQLHRSATTISTTKPRDLPQGSLQLDPYDDRTDDVPRYPTVVQGHRDHMQKFKNCVILTRVGSFYELYFEQAEIFAPKLNLKLASKKTSAGPVPMAGFPFYQLDRFLKILVEDLNKNVAISEEFANDAEDKARLGGLLFDRKITRVITPGTLIDEKFMDASQNNFLLAIYLDIGSLMSQFGTQRGIPLGACLLSSSYQRVGLSWMDLSTGDFFTQLTTPQMLSSAIARIGAREILVDQTLGDLLGQELRMLLGQDHHLTLFESPTKVSPMSEWSTMLETPISRERQSSFTREEVTAGFHLLEYVRTRLQGVNLRLQPPRRRHLDESMSIDRNTLRGLEILETARDGLKNGSLLHAVRRTSTTSGCRLLRNRLTSPSTSLNVINGRLDLVSYFLNDEGLQDNITMLLKRGYDAQRLVQKLSLGRGNSDDLLCLSRAIEASQAIKRVLLDKASTVSEKYRSASSKGFDALINQLSLDGPSELAHRILAAIDGEGLLQKQRIEDSNAADAVGLARQVTLKESLPDEIETMPRQLRAKTAVRSGMAVEPEAEAGDEDTWIMRRDASETLGRLHGDLEALKEEKRMLTQRLQDQAGSSSLSLKWTPGLGHICHIKGDKVSQGALEALGVTRNVSSTKSTRSFYLPAWSRLGLQIDQAKMHIRVEEQRIFKDLQRSVILNLVKIRRNAAVLDELDVACSFATLAKEQQMIRPVVNLTTTHKIVGGRHPTVKLSLEEQGRRFVSNDCSLGDPERVWLITGPNMAGKSTFLRQNALITLLAQVGSFVPAEYAEIGVADQIFSRIGAADDLFRDQSTFMVEMLETATILKQATPRSFVIMDEVGRGTTPEDGAAVGFACLHHLYHVNRCRTLFATHFHVLADMTQGWKQLGAYCTNVKEGFGSFSFDHRLQRGVNRKSHALKVARLAGLPDDAIRVAQEVLHQAQKVESKPISSPARSHEVLVSR